VPSLPASASAGSDATLLLIVNAHHDVVNFTLPEVPQGIYWNRLIDTNNPNARAERFDFKMNTH
jgi:isoamylase